MTLTAIMVCVGMYNDLCKGDMRRTGRAGLRDGRATNESVGSSDSKSEFRGGFFFKKQNKKNSPRHRVPENGPAASIPKHLPEGDFCLRDLQRLLLGARSRELCPKPCLLGLLGPGHVNSEAQFVSLLTRCVG